MNLTIADTYQKTLSIVSLLSLMGLFIGCIASRFTSTISIIILLLVGLYTWLNNKQLYRQHIRLSFPFLIMFMVILVSGLLSENMQEAWVRIRIALPLLAIPFLLISVELIHKEQLKKVLYFILLTSGILTAGILLNYYLNFDHYNQQIRQSGAIPTPLNDHIRYSLCLTLCLFIALHLFIQSTNKKAKSALVIYLVFIFAAIHILSVRIAILSAYFGILIAVLIWSFRSKQFIIPVILISGLIATPILSYKYIPTFRTKVHLTQHNINMMMRGEIGDYSDTQRLLSYQLAFGLIDKNPIWGTGIGDLKDEMKIVYKESYPDKPVKYPHNQFISILAASGYVGLFLFCFAFFYSIFGKAWRGDAQFIFGSIVFLSFLTENTLLNSTGMSIYVFFQLISQRLVKKVI